MGECGSTNCEAHVYLAQAVGDLKDMDRKLMEGQHELRITLTKLTENLQEMKRTNERLDRIIQEQQERDTKQDEKIEKIDKNQTRIYAVIGFLAVVGMPTIGFIIRLLFGV